MKKSILLFLGLLILCSCQASSKEEISEINRRIIELEKERGVLQDNIEKFERQETKLKKFEIENRTLQKKIENMRCEISQLRTNSSTGWNIFVHEELGIEFEYPQDWECNLGTLENPAYVGEDIIIFGSLIYARYGDGGGVAQVVAPSISISLQDSNNLDIEKCKEKTDFYECDISQRQFTKFDGIFEYREKEIIIPQKKVSIIITMAFPSSVDTKMTDEESLKTIEEEFGSKYRSIIDSLKILSE